MPVSEVIGHAMQLGAALQGIHEQGQVHGALTPDAVILNDSGLQLLPPGQAVTEAVTPYTAPEQVQGHALDARADIFAFGAILYEMLTGLRPFHGDTAEVLAESIVNHIPAPIGQPRLDRLVSTCLFKNPTARWQNMTQVIRELGASLPLEAAERASRQAATRSRLHGVRKKELEKRWTLQRGPAEGLSPRQTVSLKDISEELFALREQVAETQERAARAEQIAAEARTWITGFENPSARIQEIHNKVEVQSLTIESVRAGLQKTDALVEQMVDALGSLQNLVLDAIASVSQAPEPPRPAPTPSRAVLAHQQRRLARIR
jgi:serine/threonine protein kinase